MAGRVEAATMVEGVAAPWSWSVEAHLVPAPVTMPRLRGAPRTGFTVRQVNALRRTWDVIRADDVTLVLRGDGATALMNLLTELTETLFPTRLCLGVGLAPKVSAETALANAEHAALLALRKKSWASFVGAGAPWDESWSAGFRLAGELRQRWTRRQVQVVRLLRKGLSQKEAADKLGVSTGTVCTVLKTAHWAAMHHWETLVAGQMMDLERGSDSSAASDASVATPTPNRS